MKIHSYIFIAVTLMFTNVQYISAQQQKPEVLPTTEPVVSTLSQKQMEEAVGKGVYAALQAQQRKPTFGDYWRNVWQNFLILGIPLAIPLAFFFYLANRLAQAHGPLVISFRRRTKDDDIRGLVSQMIEEHRHRPDPAT